MSAFGGAAADPTVRQRLDGLGMVIFPPNRQNPESLAAYHNAEAAKWWPIINTAGIKGSN
jgi:hypothetical protein